ncbi:MAG: hydroxyethylthiazole kinase [Firmicutes bacterium]|nr:hydroxyethylthiazole kinase [Bacillota bacterium]
MDKSVNYIKQAALALDKIRSGKPLVHSLTNYVVMNQTANILLHIGASPVMAHAQEEVEEMAALAGALVLNIGTLDPYWVESMIMAGRAANAKGVPVVLDPVGAGATRFRTDSCMRILEQVKVDLIRGNSAEVSILAGMEAKIKGVDAVGTADTHAAIARRAAEVFGVAAAVTGAQDAVSDGITTLLIDNGHPLLGELTGTGCMATALTGAFLAVEKDPLAAALGALVSFGIAGEWAAKVSQFPGSFQVALFDEVYRLRGVDLTEGARVVVGS